MAEVIEVPSDTNNEEDFDTSTVVLPKVEEEESQDNATFIGFSGGGMGDKTTDTIFGDSSVGGNSTTDASYDGETLLSILLKEPEQMRMTEKSSAIRTDKVFTLDAKVITVESMKADDNGPYVYKGTSTKPYFYDKNDGAFMVHKYDNILYYYNKREGNKYSKEFVSRQNIYEVTRRYRQSKFNPAFNNTIVTVRKVSTGVTLDYYLVIYKWHGSPSKDFTMPRHGNATKPSTSPYYRQEVVAVSKQLYEW